MLLPSSTLFVRVKLRVSFIHQIDTQLMQHVRVRSLDSLCYPFLYGREVKKNVITHAISDIMRSFRFPLYAHILCGIWNFS